MWWKPILEDKSEDGMSENTIKTLEKYCPADISSLDRRDMGSVIEIARKMKGDTLLQETRIEQNFLIIKMLGDIKLAINEGRKHMKKDIDSLREASLREFYSDMEKKVIEELAKAGADKVDPLKEYSTSQLKRELMRRKSRSYKERRHL